MHTLWVYEALGNILVSIVSDSHFGKRPGAGDMTILGSQFLLHVTEDARSSSYNFHNTVPRSFPRLIFILWECHVAEKSDFTCCTYRGGFFWEFVTKGIATQEALPSRPLAAERGAPQTLLHLGAGRPPNGARRPAAFSPAPKRKNRTIWQRQRYDVAEREREREKEIRERSSWHVWEVWPCQSQQETPKPASRSAGSRENTET